jgi:hypothetical protein
MNNDPKTKTNRTLLSRYRLHVIPAKSVAAENIPRYAETRAESDGSFAFKNLAPGKYWLLARPLPVNESTEVQTRPAAWDASERDTAPRGGNFEKCRRHPAVPARQ